MDGETVETVTEWASEPFEGGYAGLHDLASREFTGAVTDGTAWLFVLNGRVVGVADGDVESFADAEGTAYAAPDPSLPLLFAMRERGGETKAKYYTNDTPLSEVDETLSAANFTGYVELSENVISGDYYVVYHGGRSLACAFVGTARRTLTGDEALARATEEVGIYEVREVDVSVVDVPEPEPASADDPGAGADEADEADEVDGPSAGVAAGRTDPDDAGPVPDAEGDAPAPPEADDADPGADDADPGADDATSPDEGEGPTDAPEGVTIDLGTGGADDADGDEGDADPEGDRDAVPEAEAEADAEADDRPTDAAVGPTEMGAAPDPDGLGGDDDADASHDAGPGEDAGPEDDGVPADDDAAADDADATGAADPDEERDDAGDADAADGRPYARRDGEPTDAVSGAESDPFSAEEQWRETRSIPALDPADAGDPPGGAAAAADAAGLADPDEGEETGADAADAEGADADGGATRERLDEARTDLDEVRGELAETRTDLDEAREQLDAVRADRDSTGAEADRLREENDRLRERVGELEADLETAREEAAAARERAPDVPTQRTIPADRALAGTNLFVRYDSKRGPTLEDALTADARAGEVNDNLRLERHTDFEAEGTVVDGRPFGEFLADSLEYGFVEWAVRDLLYEIRETRNESGLRGLFTALPSVDRAELHGAVEVVDEAGEPAGERTFDVVLRDRMGAPLVVANVTDSRDPTTESMVDDLVEGATAVAERRDELGAAFHVSASFFEPGALERAADATGGGLLGRSKHESFVRLSRKRGYHLCLAEAREGEFHVTVPEL